VPSSALASFRFRGVTNQGQPVSVLLPESVRQVSRFTIVWRANCVTGNTYTDATSDTGIRITRTLRFKDTGSYTVDLGNGFFAQINGQLTGKLSRRAALVTGTWFANVTVVDSNQQLVDTCNTGTVSWRARLRR
jgi:hypothetical protein